MVEDGGDAPSHSGDEQSDEDEEDDQEDLAVFESAREHPRRGRCESRYVLGSLGSLESKQSNSVWGRRTKMTDEGRYAPRSGSDPLSRP